MNIFKNCVRDLLLLIVFVAACSADEVDDGFLNVHCNEAKDCYVLDDSHFGLHLACYYNVNKCKCQNTFRSDFHLKWENKRCLMSKYGPCGAKGELAVGCQDGFVCVDNQCRDPNDTSPRSVKLTPFVFTESKCGDGGCLFADNMRLTCNHESDQCECSKVYVADSRSTYWDIRNYDGDNNCSVGKFGPCGTKNGITISCHGDGITCVNGTCLNANHLLSEVGEECAAQKNCKEGLLCSSDYVCILPFSLAEGKLCSGDNQCQEGLQCKFRGRRGFGSSRFCTKIN